MIDVVFLLLIFFMCTSTFLRPEHDLPSRLPAAGLPGSTPEPLDPVRIRLSVADDGVRVACDGQPARSREHLASMLRARRSLGDPPVIIAGTDAVPFDDMVAALDACHAAGLYRTAFAAGGASP